MAGEIGSVDISGTNAGLTGTSEQLLNPVDVLVYNTGDLVNRVRVGIAIVPGADGSYTVGLMRKADFSAGVDGAELAWSKDITIPAATPTGLFEITFTGEPITATAGEELACVISSRNGGSTINFKQGATSSSKSHGAAGAALPSTWTQTTTSTRQLALAITTVLGSSTPIAKLSSVTSPSSSSSSMSSRG